MVTKSHDQHTLYVGQAVSEPIILGITKPTEQHECIFTVAGAGVGEYIAQFCFVAQQNVILITSRFDHALKGNLSIYNITLLLTPNFMV